MELEKFNFSEAQLRQLNALSAENLSETEQISFELLRFVLQNRMDEYTYDMHLNLIQADQGFHLNPNYRIGPILTHNDAKAHLKVLNDIPHYVEQQLPFIAKEPKRALRSQKLFLRDMNLPTATILYPISLKVHFMFLSKSFRK